MESYAVEGAGPAELEWESDDEAGGRDLSPTRAILYDRTEDNMDAWSDGDGGEEEGDDEDVR